MNYRHLFFDLDGTLWDLKKNTHLALEMMFQKFNLGTEQGIVFEEFFRRYHYHNDQVWALYRDGKIEKNVLRIIRFERAFNDVNFFPSDDFIDLFADEFLDICPKLPHLLDGTHDLLTHCIKKNYTLHIITNGFVEVQGHKMNAGNLNGYFTHIINSEAAGVRKPHSGIFEYAFKLAGTHASESLMIGDDWDADILGAKGVGMDQVFLRSTEEMMHELGNTTTHRPIRHNHHPTYSIGSLRELIEIL